MSCVSCASRKYLYINTICSLLHYMLFHNLHQSYRVHWPIHSPKNDCASFWTCMRFLVFWMETVSFQWESYFHTARTIFISSLGLWNQLNLRLNQLVVMSHKRTEWFYTLNTHCLLFQVMQIPFTSVSIIHGCPAELPFTAWSCAYPTGLWNFFFVLSAGLWLMEWFLGVKKFCCCFCRLEALLQEDFCEEVKCSN